MEAVDKKRVAVLWGLLALVFACVPISGNDYYLTIANRILVWGMFAVAFNMLFGVTGMLSFGQALFYGLGGYGVGLMVKYLGKAWFLPGLGLGVMAAALVAYLLGFLIIRASGVFFTILTLAFGQLAWQITFRWYNVTGGDDGIQGLIPPGILGNRVVYYYFCLVLVLASIWFLQRLANSPQGLILRCLRQNPSRVRFLGRRVKRNQRRVYLVSSVFAALAGGLMAGVDNSIHTNMLNWTTSGEVILMSVLGGIHQFFGPFVGAAVIKIIEDVVGARTEYWSLIIGLVMMTMVLAFPRGLVGELALLKARLKWRALRRAERS
ncbi:MAG: branched-chain amino acid ABC transporter permease [Pseudomonadota bacterium]